MAEPTKEEKLAAAQEALAAMDPPRTEEDIAPNTLEAVVAVVWSQLALVPPALAPAQGEMSWPLFFRAQTTADPALQDDIKAYNAQGEALSARITAANRKTTAPG